MGHNSHDTQWTTAATLDFHRQSNDVKTGRGQAVELRDVFESRNIICEQNAM